MRRASTTLRVVQSRELVPFAAVVVVIAGSLALVATQLDTANVYLTSDAGHYLEDSDALFGRGVREIRHPPLFPLFVWVIRLFVANDLLAVKVTILAVLAVLTLSFYVFVRGRTGSMLSDVAATGLFALGPTTAEAVGWFGGASLFGIALSLVALRLISDLIENPAVWRAIAVAIAIAAVVLTHPFSVVFLAETAAAYLAFRFAVALVRTRSLKRTLSLLLSRSGLVVITIGGGLLAVVPARTFYSVIQNPLVLTPALDQLSQIWTWAFRDDPVVWLSLLVASFLITPLARWTGGDRGMDVGLTVTALNVVTVFNVAFLQGNLSYVTRSLYFTPVVIATTFGVALAAIFAAASRYRPSAQAVAITASLALIVLVGAPAIQSFTYRLDVAVPYYNQVDQRELAAIDYLSGRKGTVIVTSKGANLDAGTEYSWMIEGLARVRALGSGTSFVSLSAIADEETADAERFAAGPAVLEDGRIRAAFDGTTASRIKVYGNVDRTWYHLFDVEPHSGPPAVLPSTVALSSGQGYAEISSQIGATDPPATVRLDESDHQLHAVFPASQLGADGQADIVLAVDGGRLRLTGTGFVWQIGLDGKSVTVSFSAPGVVAAQNQTSLAMRTSVAGQPLAITVDVAGLNGSPTSLRTFTQSQLIQDQDIRYVWTWRSTATLAELAARPCLQLAYENDVVALFNVDGTCGG